MDTTRKRITDRSLTTNDGKKTDTNDASSMSAMFFTVFFTGWIFVIVEKCVSGNWNILNVPAFPMEIHSYMDLDAILIVVGWFSLQCVLYMTPVGGNVVDGVQIQETNTRLKYRLNAFFVLCVNLLGFMLAVLFGVRVTIVSEKILQIATSGVLMILVLSIVLIVKGQTTHRTENTFNNWFNGIELNPRWGMFDLKYVCFRSGIIGWILLNLTNMVEAYGTKEGPTTALLMVAGFQLLYVCDYFWFEDGVLVTRDIVHEHLGYYLLVQFLMIPFCFAVQTRYLMMTKYLLPWYCMGAVIMINILGFWIYRGSNSEKNNFRKNPKDTAFAKYEVIPTSTGKNLLVSGWWGISRHPNYLGDLIISFTYALPTGFNHFLPYLNPLFLLMMLVDRERKDFAECQKRYGEAWNEYCQRVKYRIVPYIY